MEGIIAAAADPTTGKPMTPAVRQRILGSQEVIRRAERVVRLRPDPRWKAHDLGGAAQSDAIDVAEAYGVGPAARRLLEIIT